MIFKMRELMNQKHSQKSFETWVCSVFHALSEKNNENKQRSRESVQHNHYWSIGVDIPDYLENDELVFSSLDVSVHSEQQHNKKLRVSAGFRSV